MMSFVTSEGLTPSYPQSSALIKLKKRKNTQASLDVFSLFKFSFVTSEGFEPPTIRAEI